MLSKVQIKTFSPSEKKTIKNRVTVGVGLAVFWFVLVMASFFSSTNIVTLIFGIQKNHVQVIIQFISSILTLLLILPFLLLSYFEINKIYSGEDSFILYKFSLKPNKQIKLNKFIKNPKSLLILSSLLLLSFLVPTIALIARNTIFSINNMSQIKPTNNLTVILFASMILSLIIWLIAVIIILRKFKINSFRDTFSFFLISFVTNAGFISLFFLTINRGFGALLFLFSIVSLSDIFAYLGGTLYGKKKLIPSISPNKTLEGFLTGLVVSVAISLSICGFFYYIDTITFDINKPLLTLPEGGLLDSLLFGLYTTKQNSEVTGIPGIFIQSGPARDALIFISLFFLGIAISLASTIGDLFFSYIKRIHNIKDYSKVLKEHGGVLDRFDSVLFSATFYIFCYFIILIFLQFMN